MCIKNYRDYYYRNIKIYDFSLEQYINSFNKFNLLNNLTQLSSTIKE